MLGLSSVSFVMGYGLIVWIPVVIEDGPSAPISLTTKISNFYFKHFLPEPLTAYYLVLIKIKTYCCHSHELVKHCCHPKLVGRRDQYFMSSSVS